MHHPAIRIYLFGEFFIERLASSSVSLTHTPVYERVPSQVWQSRGPAMTLLKVLLCRPRRRATKDELIEALWPENDEIDGNHAFDSAASVLRKVLKTHLSEHLLITVRGQEGSVLKLPDQQHVWVDADAFEIHVDQATKAERSGQDALPLWEAAHERLAGEFLEDNLYSSWAQTRRQVLNAARHRCIHRLTNLYLSRGFTDQAETLLHFSLIDDPTDEDVLYRLLFLLEKQSRYQEAWQLYEQTVRVLNDELHISPSARTQELAERIHNATALPESSLTAVVTASDILAAQPCAKIENGSGEQLSSVRYTSVTSELETGDMNPSRRKLLQQTPGLVGTALMASHELLDPSLLERLARVLTKPSSIDEKTLIYFETCTANYYRDRHTATLASHHLLGYVLEHLQRLTTLLEEPLYPAIRLRLCSIAGEVAMLAGELLFDMRDYSHARDLHQLATVAAREANNHLLEAIASGRIGFTWLYEGNAQAGLPFLQEALRLALQTGDITVQAWLAAVEAEMQANLGNQLASLHALDEAECIDREEGSKDKDYRIHFDRSLLEGYKGTCFLRLSTFDHADNQLLEKARCALIEALALLNPTMVRRQSTYLVDLAGVYAQAGEVELASKHAIEALTLTTTMKSGVVLQRLLTLRTSLDPWKGTRYIRDLDEQIAPLLRLEWYRRGGI